MHLRLTPYCLCGGCKDVKHPARRFPQDWPDSAENTAAAALSAAINHAATRLTHFQHDVCGESPIPVNQVITRRPVSNLSCSAVQPHGGIEMHRFFFCSIYRVIFCTKVCNLIPAERIIALLNSWIILEKSAIQINTKHYKSCSLLPFIKMHACMLHLNALTKGNISMDSGPEAKLPMAIDLRKCKKLEKMWP